MTIFDERNVHEYFANEFAMALLMPPKELKKLLLEDKSEYEIAYSFGVSVPVLREWIRRLKVTGTFI